MRLTVGPLPAAVYWRRRAVVLGALLVIIFFFYVSCSDSGSADGRKTAGTGTQTPAVSTTGPEPTETLLTPETGGPPGTGDAVDPVGPPDGTPDPSEVAPPPQAPAGGEEACSDAEITITPLPAKTTVARKSPLDIRLKIENTGDRSCGRDVGADLQELRIVQGAQTIWSSDHCGPQRGSDVRTFGPGSVREYMVTWNGKSSSKCSAGTPAGPVPPAGQYQVLARLGTKHSAQVTLTLT